METLLLVPHAGLSTALRFGRDDTLSDKGMSINSDDAVIGIQACVETQIPFGNDKQRSACD
jgi:hypothetical protein